MIGCCSVNEQQHAGAGVSPCPWMLRAARSKGRAIDALIFKAMFAMAFSQQTFR